MSWIKLDDNWMDHPKIIKAGRDARDMWLASITWCAKHLTDGYFPSNLLSSLAATAGVDVANCQTFANTLLEVCLWDATDNGYMVHDYLDYNPSKEQALATREARKTAGRAGGVAKASKMPSKKLAKPVANSWQKSAPYPYPFPSPNGANPVEKKKLIKDSATPQKSAEHSILFEIAKALADVTGMDFEKNRGRLFREAKAYKPEELEQLIRDYSPGGPWYLYDWRGMKGQLPTTATIRDTWKKISNGSRQHILTAPPPVAEEY